MSDAVLVSIITGGFGVIGDIVSTGQASWGGGFPSYIAGPMPQVAQDVYNLTFKNALEFASGAYTGEIDTNFAQELSKFGKSYMPMGQTLAIGPAMDRLFWDQLQIWLDPESVEALSDAARKRQNLTGGGDWWMPGSPIPSRAPNFASAIGQ